MSERRDLQVVEFYRNEVGHPRKRVVANLRRIDGTEDGHLDALIRDLCRVAGRDEPAVLEIAHASAKAFGDVIALYALWKDLGFDRALGRAPRSGKRKLDVEALVRAMDALLDNVERVETEWAKQIPPLVNRDLTVIFYDQTTVRIHA